MTDKKTPITDEGHDQGQTDKQPSTKLGCTAKLVEGKAYVWTHNEWQINGKTYHSLEEMPPDIRELAVKSTTLVSDSADISTNILPTTSSGSDDVLWQIGEQFFENPQDAAQALAEQLCQSENDFEVHFATALKHMVQANAHMAQPPNQFSVQAKPPQPQVRLPAMPPVAPKAPPTVIAAPARNQPRPVHTRGSADSGTSRSRRNGFDLTSWLLVGVLLFAICLLIWLAA